MNKEQVVGIAVRLFAIFLGIYTFRHVSGLLPYAAAPSPNYISFSFLFLLAAFPLLAAILLWLFPLAVAAKIIPNIKEKETPAALDAGGIEVVAFSVMGLWVLTYAIPDIFYWVTYVYRIKNINIGSPELTPENIGYIVSTIVELVIGFWLLFGSSGLLGVIRRARDAGA
jgi:hypothetical protein